MRYTVGQRMAAMSLREHTQCFNPTAATLILRRLAPPIADEVLSKQHRVHPEGRSRGPG